MCLIRNRGAGKNKDYFLSSGFIWCFCNNGIWINTNKKFNPITPKTLKLTQNSSVCVRQTISFSRAMAIKKIAQRFVKMRQPFSEISKAFPKTIFKNSLSFHSPINKLLPNIKLTTVGLILIKISSFNRSVNPPNMLTVTAVKIGRKGSFRSMTIVIIILTTVATSKPPVAQNRSFLT